VKEGVRGGDATREEHKSFLFIFLLDNFLGKHSSTFDEWLSGAVNSANEPGKYYSLFFS
jgi:hypothetical protein